MCLREVVGVLEDGHRSPAVASDARTARTRHPAYVICRTSIIVTTQYGGPMTTAADALTERLFTSAVASFDIAGVYLGDRLGWYRSLAADGPATPDELATRTGTDARYAREWLEQQAVGGILEVAEGHRFSLSEDHAAVLADPDSIAFMAPLTRMLAAAFGRLPSVVEAYRSGTGVGWESYGA